MLAELKSSGQTLDAAVAQAEDRLSLLRAIRQATKVEGNGKVKPAGERKPKAKKNRDAAPAGEALPDPAFDEKAKAPQSPT